jgi:transposase
MTEKHWAKAPVLRSQLQLYPQCLDEIVPACHPIRMLEVIMSQMDWSAWEAHYDGHSGQPPIHPRLMAGAILYGLMRRIRSSRELEDATHERLDYMWWFECRTVDHSTFAKFRTQFNDELKKLNSAIGKEICSRYQDTLMGLVLDGTRVRADSDRHGSRTAASLERLVAACVTELNKRLEHLGELDKQEDAPDLEKESLRKEVEQLKHKIDKYEVALSVAHERDEKKQEEHGKAATPVRVPVTDPDAQLTPNKEGGFAPNYLPVAGVNSATGHIAYEDVLPDSDENMSVAAAVQSVAAEQGDMPAFIAADSGFASGENLKWLEEQQVVAYMPTNTDFREKNPANRSDLTRPVPAEQVEYLPCKNGKFSHAAFIYDAQEDRYYCPAGQALLPVNSGHYHRTKVGYRKYQCPGCEQCPLSKQCVTEKAEVRTVQRDEYQAHRERTGKRMATAEGRAIYGKRAPVVEGVFAVLKHIMGIRRFLLRGLDKVRIEWHWICGAYNLKRLLTLMMAMNTGSADTDSRLKRNGAGANDCHTAIFCTLLIALAIVAAVQWHRCKSFVEATSTDRVCYLPCAD